MGYMRTTYIFLLLSCFAAAAYAGDSGAEAAKGKAAALLRQSAAARKAGKYRTCIALAGRALKADPSYAYAYAGRGACYFSLGKDAAAMKDLDEAVKLAPGDADLRADHDALAAAIERHAGAGGTEGTAGKKLQPAGSLWEKPEQQEAQEEAPAVKPDGRRCVHPEAWGGRRYCNWYDAQDYCGGKLPAVEQLLELNMSECPSGSKNIMCGCRIWAADDAGGGKARTVSFVHGGDVRSDNKDNTQVFVFCLK